MTITPEMEALANLSAGTAAQNTLEVTRSQAMGKLHHHLSTLRNGCQKLEGRVSEISTRTASCSERQTNLEAEFRAMRERWDGMLRYCYRVCKSDNVKAAAGIDQPDSSIVRLRPWDLPESATAPDTGASTLKQDGTNGISANLFGDSFDL